MSRKLVWINDGPRSQEASENRGLLGEIDVIHRANELYW